MHNIDRGDEIEVENVFSLSLDVYMYRTLFFGNHCSMAPKVPQLNGLIAWIPDYIKTSNPRKALAAESLFIIESSISNGGEGMLLVNGIEC
jgi:hypothetical protein